MLEDIFIPKSSADAARVSPLHTVTIITSDKEQLERIFCEGYKLEFSGWKSCSDTCVSQYLLLDSNNTFEFGLFYLSAPHNNIQIRVLAHNEDSGPIRPSTTGLHLGGATLSFPIEDLYEHEKTMRSLEISSTMGVKEMEFTSPTGETYISAEIVYPVADNVFIMGVKRPDIFIPVGPVKEHTKIGAAAYSSRCIQHTDKTLKFFQDILGYEIRRDVEFVVGEQSALNMPEGTNERFIQGFAPGSASGYVVLMDHKDGNIPAADDNYLPPKRGIVMWSFETSDLDAIVSQAEEIGVEVLKTPDKYGSPGLPSSRSAILKDPDGFAIEVFESV